MTVHTRIDAASWPSRSNQLFSTGIYMWAVAVVVAVALIAGGASRQNAIPVMVVQMISALLLPFALTRATERRLWRSAPLATTVAACVLALPLLQLIPLPPQVWTSLPGRETALSVYAAAGIEPPWLPLSLTPALTLRSWLALLPAIIVFVAVATLSVEQRRSVIMVVLGIVLLSLVVGLFQRMGGPRSPAYLYLITNRDSLVGFFANKNHEASLLVASIPFAGAIIADLLRRRQRAGWIMAFAAAAIFLSVAGLAEVRSRSGLALLVPALLGSALLLWRAGAVAGLRRGLVIGGALAVAGVALIAVFALPRVIDRFRANAGEDMRFILAPDIWRAAQQHLPFGSGLGSFDTIYRGVERLQVLTGEYVNHAHNDYLELWLELGAAAVICLALFLLWFFMRSVAAWRAKSGATTLAKAGSAAIVILMLHSALDYPLRTVALSCLFALSCALMITPPQRQRTM